MIETIYIEDAVRDHPRTRAVLDRFPGARQIACGRYNEVFNPAAQNFRLQKRRPSLILARKEGTLVHRAPPGLGIGREANFYFSHMFNCVYDCRYCFLQGMFRSAHYVLFVNYEDFQAAIDATREDIGHQPASFFSGYDCDSVALESVTGFAEEFVPFFAARPDAELELRTKSAATRHLLAHEPVANIITAFSFTPDAVASAVEHGTPSVEARLAAMSKLAMAGWRLGVRLDPLLWYDGWAAGYDELISSIAAAIPAAALHSISVGPLRFPRDMFHRIETQYPDEPLLAGPLEQRGSIASYGAERENDLMSFVRQRISERFAEATVFSYTLEAS